VSIHNAIGIAFTAPNVLYFGAVMIGVIRLASGRMNGRKIEGETA